MAIREGEIMARRRARRVVGATLVALLVTFGVMTGVARGTVTVSGPGLGTLDFLSVTPTSVVYGLTFGSVAPIDMVFSGLPAGTYSVTTFPIEADTIFNKTGTSWTDYHFLLGSGSVESFTPFTAATNQGLDFLAPFSSDVFTILSQTTEALAWSGGFVPNNGGVNFAFGVTVPQGITVFTLRQFPTTAQVPEPSALLLLGSGLAGLAGLAWGQGRHGPRRAARDTANRRNL